MTPRLQIICSSREGQARLDRLAAAMLGRMPETLALRLAREVLVFALDGSRHRGFAQGVGGQADVVSGVADERSRQGIPGGPLSVIVIYCLPGRELGRLLGHELGHVACGHTGLNRGAAADLSDDEVAAMEIEAEAFATEYAEAW